MADYHLYFFGSDGHIRRRMDLQCDDDEQAIQVVTEHISHGAMELWQADRLVKRFDQGPKSS